jgi:hypothetical protein
VERDDDWRPSPAGPSPVEAGLLGLAVSVLLLVNGRPIGAGDTRANEYTAASLAQEADFDLDEYPEVEAPFARTVGGRRVSIYPPLTPLFAAPVFLAARAGFALDENGSAVAGKVAAALFSGVAAGALFMAVGRRRTRDEAAVAALLFALGTSVWSTSQALWQHPLALAFLSLALLCLVRAEHEPEWAGRAFLPLALAAAARPAGAALVLAVGAATALRWPRKLPWMALWAAGPAALVCAYNAAYFGSPLAHGFAGAAARFDAGFGPGHLGLLVSPAKGLLVFTPLVVVAAAGLARALRAGERGLPLTVAAGVAAHWLLMGFWGEWHGGRAWGPRLMTEVLPLLFVYLPEGLDVMPRLGAALAAVSVGAQALGAFAYDYRWERLYQHAGADRHASLWDVGRSPIPFYLQRRVFVPALPRVDGGRLTVREHPLVAFGARGSRVRFERERPTVSGVDETLGDVFLERAVRVEEGGARLRARWDGVFLRATPRARSRRLELRLRGRGQGLLYVGERSFWSAGTRWTPYRVSGRFALAHPYEYATSGGSDLVVTVGTGGGDVTLESLALVPPGEPEKVVGEQERSAPAGAALAPLELGAQDLVVVALGGLHQPQRARAAGDRDHVGAVEREAALSVERDVDLALARGAQAHLHHGLVPDHQRPVAEHVRADRREHHGRQGGMEDGAARGQVVGGRAGRRRHDQAVGAERGDEQPVHRDLQLDDARERRLGDHHVVEHVADHLGLLLAHHARAEHAALLGTVFAAQHAFEGGEQLGHGDLGQEPQAAEVDAQHRHRLLHEMAGGEQRAVSAEHHQHVRARRHLAPGRHLHARAGGILDQGGGPLLQHGLQVAAAEPLHQLPHRRLRAASRIRAGHDADRAHENATFRMAASRSCAKSPSPDGRTCRKNSRLPSAPVIGDGHPPTMA